MAALTIRNIPDEVLSHIKKVAHYKATSMEQEVREMLKIRYTDRTKILARARKRWTQLPETTSNECVIFSIAASCGELNPTDFASSFK